MGRNRCAEGSFCHYIAGQALARKELFRRCRHLVEDAGRILGCADLPYAQLTKEASDTSRVRLRPKGVLFNNVAYYHIITYNDL